MVRKRTDARLGLPLRGSAGAIAHRGRGGTPSRSKHRYGRLPSI